MQTETKALLVLLVVVGGVAFFLIHSKNQTAIKNHTIVDPAGPAVQQVGGKWLNRDGSQATANDVVKQVASQNATTAVLSKVGSVYKAIIPW